MGRHSQGPWRVVTKAESAKAGGWPVAYAGDDLSIYTAPCSGSELGCAEDDARLIAAAPDLLVSLKDIFTLMDEGVLVRNIDDDGKPDFALRMIPVVGRLKRAHDAIAKAEGA
jgi:hypothetical protein